MPDTFDSDPESLPPVTAALRQCWIANNPGTIGAQLDAVPAPFSMRAVLDAVHALELRVAALEAA
ncbi:hypothetical protein B1987_13695 [Mycobacterium kansasii]|uniref:Uncharacterized protein n=1 Tax=Mycobacterium attenuatum TaxID=2341086 RepID=A0A498QGH8_9MYCO|nr:hypothetical protein [Mycobacterium attenuatum]ORB84674.1 hypothetical protein B1987_13695 [Mycobacterium kansasii]VBA43953.1 hypothetical protein LAUMK136_05359 [Mycobacterium attenuatum]